MSKYSRGKNPQVDCDVQLLGLQAAELLRYSPKRLSKNAIHYSDPGFTSAFLATANEDAYPDFVREKSGLGYHAMSKICSVKFWA